MSSPASSTAKVSTTQPYLLGLNNLRAIAALFVCCRHFAGLLPERERIDALREVVALGPMGVYFFFVISGYIVPYSLFRKDYRLPELGRYLWRRFVRLAPPFYIATLLTLVQWAAVSKLLGRAPDPAPSLPQLLHNALFTIPFSGYKWVIAAAWTLAVEWQFYLVLGLAFPLVFAHRRAGWYFLLASGLLALLGPAAGFGLSFLSLSSLFSLGGATLLWQRRQLPLPAYLASALFFTAATAYYVNPLAAGIGLVAVPALVFITRPLPLLDGLGKMAFSLVLTHMLVGQTVEYLLFRLIGPTTDAGRLLVLGGCLAAALAGAALFYRWVERPFIRLSSRRRPAAA
jgi:peptidoglycan/LPS O-acetylase OafA/YrhL